MQFTVYRTQRHAYTAVADPGIDGPGDRPTPLAPPIFFLTTQITSHKTEQNLIVGRSKSEAELVLDILWIVLLADTKYRAASL